MDVYERAESRDAEFVVHLYLIESVLSYPSLTHSWSQAFLEKQPIVQLLKNFPAFYGTQWFITVFTRALNWSLSGAG
jgi:hypothetical protein